MIKIIVDSNIIFSALLNINSRIGQILISGKKNYDFYAPKYVRTEILEHQKKIQKIAKLNNDDFFEVYELILKKLQFLIIQSFQSKILINQLKSVKILMLMTLYL
ncbi:PIN domain-containing protein [Zunongwangia sp. F260]|uniref:PIN domain-containing protein n=1 Tax=Autumnicola lenta TaxID=3075593 RepID=A0ABU3CJ48_9FLAO|nr:PIN domain-containing protein [Zunongwangia sp. F260]MDT0646364.1 PIN domain-containing protein [Zunongwangia sp. F260]